MIDLKKGTRGAALTSAPRHSVQQVVRFYLSIYPEGLTRRELHNHSGIEIATLCAALKAMELKNEVHTPRTVTCKTTGREVVVYTKKGIE
ncbi:hypothetical protein VAC51_00033 [Variovorax phage VAC_51]|uniref:Uncharacterized protein n=1 Tax=Variovorax phage VAC_51 TaxID=2985242 RepID=A0A9N6WZR6_9CAUD|nr:hypothetical protein VAC51_00033 [Variovorax phage VAC_51]